jgi:hypothetical protein
VQQFLAEKKLPLITQPLYSSDLSPSDFLLFPTLKIGLKGTHGGHQTECDNQTREDSERSSPPFLSTITGSIEQVCLCVCVCVCVCVCNVFTLNIIR